MSSYTFIPYFLKVGLDIDSWVLSSSHNYLFFYDLDIEFELVTINQVWFFLYAATLLVLSYKIFKL